LGIPLSFTAFAKSGELISFAYWTVAAAWNRAEFDYELWHTAPFRMPMRAICLALTVHSAFGAVIFSYWIDDMEFVPALYFSFVSITTIGYGRVRERGWEWAQWTPALKCENLQVISFPSRTTYSTRL